jgi:arylsulfatase A-like enzyme
MPGQSVSRRALLRGAAAAGAAAAIGPLAACASSSSRVSARPPSKQNVIVILADDMRYDETPYLPNITREFGKAGVTFSAARHNIALCSPARAGFLTGLYSFRHRVRSQLDSFEGLNDAKKTLPVWMQAAGYETGLVGKYFTPAANTRSPGWSYRRQLTEGMLDETGYSVWDGTKTVTPDEDQVHYLRAQVVDFVGSAQEPFFLWFTPTEPHWPLQPLPEYADDFVDLDWPDNREPDVSDKPTWIQSLPPVTDAHFTRIVRSEQFRLRELLGVDDTVKAIFGALDKRGVLDNTLLMFSSDNGVLQGEHRVSPLTKNLPYEPSMHVPCLLRGPGLSQATVKQPVLMSVDLTATCVDVAGAAPDLALDGVSLLEVLHDPGAQNDRVLLYDRDDRDNDPGFECPPAAGVSTVDRKLVRYETTPPIYELYDLENDPGESTNLADDPAYADDRTQLESQLNAMLAT